MTRIGFIGAGKAGCSFGKYIAQRASSSNATARAPAEEAAGRPADVAGRPNAASAPPFRLSGYFSRSASSARDAARFTGSRAFASIEALAAESDLILLAVPDGAIAEVWSRLRGVLEVQGWQGARAARGAAPSRGAFLGLLGHLSGSLGSEVFAGARELSVSGGSIHPLAALHDRRTAWEALGKSYFTVEGDAAFTSWAGALLASLGNPFCVIGAAQKALYHTASATISNLVAAVAYAGTEMYRACGLPDDFAEHAWRPLFSENAKTIVEIGPVRALTGPLERGDAQTVAKHAEALRALPKPYGEAYRALSQILLKAAEEKHPDQDYGAIRDILAKSMLS